MKTIAEAIKKTERPVKVLQFGEGNFLRAFVDWIIDLLNEKGGFNGSVMMVQPLAKGMGDMINDQNMDCEGKCAGNNKAVAERELEFTLLHAQKVKSCHGQNHRRPNIEARASADKDANHGHEHDVQTRQKAGLADRCVQQPELLQRLGNKKRRAAAKAAQPKTRIFPGACRRLLRFGCRGGGSAESLGDKARSPDCRSNEKQKIVSCLKRHWFCVILDLIFAQTIDFVYFDDESRSRFGNRKNALPARF